MDDEKLSPGLDRRVDSSLASVRGHTYTLDGLSTVYLQSVIGARIVGGRLDLQECIHKLHHLVKVGHVTLLPLDGSGRFRRDVVCHAVDSLYLVDDAGRHSGQHL